MSLEKQEVKDGGAEEVNFLDAVLGGEVESHSPEAEEGKGTEAEAPEEAEDAGDRPIPEGAEESGFSEPDDSIEGKEPVKEPEKAPDKTEADTTALKEEIEGLKKRLHDTQAAMHKATGERSALQKELAELKAKKESEDDWFSEDDKDREEKLEKELKATDEELARQSEQAAELERKNAEAQWDAAAAPVIAKHPDFEKVMYDEFAPLLDAKNGNPQVRAGWAELKDKSPQSAYEYAKKVLEALEIQRDPEAYKAKVRKEIENERMNPGAEERVPVGKAGLDMVQSADYPIDTGRRERSFVNAVFG